MHAVYFSIILTCYPLFASVFSCSLLTFIPLGKVELKVAIPVLSCDLSHQERPTKGKYFPLINKGLLVGVINLGKEILLTNCLTFL